VNEDQAGRVSQVVECLPGKPETLSSNPKQRKKKKRMKVKGDFLLHHLFGEGVQVVVFLSMFLG
jgi:hypothetical protein